LVTPAEKLKAAAGDPQAQGETPAGGESRVFRAALVQTACYLGDLERNCQLHLERIEAARAEGVDLIVFPELSLTGYFIRDMVPDVALPADAPAIGELIDSAGDADLVLGFVEESPGHRFYNAALYASGGNVVHVHRKVYLPTYGLFGEGRYFARGERVRAFDTARFGRVGLVVCEDFWHLSVATIMQAEGVDVLICIANSPARGMAGETIGTAETYDLFTRTFARLLGAAVIFVNRVGFEDGLCFWGGSRVVDPAGSIVAEAPLLDEALLVATIDTDEIRRQRIATPLSRDERLLLTTEELNRIRRARYEQ
jgi:predicted amidohydrolase